MRWIKKNIGISSFSILILTLVIFIVVYHILHLADEYKQNLEIDLAYYILTVTLSTILILLASIKSQEAIKQSRTNYLLRIDERWSSPEIIRAREVIHELYLDAKELNPQFKENNEQIKAIISFGIMKLHDDKRKTEKFISLLNFLDFLETIGYLHSQDSISTEEVSDLLGNSIVYFYDIFSIYIAYRRKSKDIGFYLNFEKLYLKVKTNCIQIKERNLSNKSSSEN
ncbi:DUF4760 domain-containing protein [Legionella sp. CNM-4043-24]|uniref:DUF4760 domain-containing protein n=1 Tax=Legionella sp. CNM-4043-24 TaxID=3421646 RepID=UPI00403B0BB5